MRSLLLCILLFLTGLIFYTATLRGVIGNPSPALIKGNLDQPTKPFELSPERGRYLLTLSLAHDKSFALSPELADAAYPDVGLHDGRYYVFFAPGISLLVLPFYIIGQSYNYGQIAAFSAIGLFASANIILLYLISRSIIKLPAWASVAAGLVFAFASTALSYATTMYQHHVTTFFTLLAFYAAWQFKQQGKASFLWAIVVWLSYGLAITLDYPNVILLLPVMIYFAIAGVKMSLTDRKLLISVRPALYLTAVVFAIITTIHGYYNYVNFGSPTKLSGSIVGLKTIREQSQFGQQALADAVRFEEENKGAANFFREQNLPGGIYELTVAPDKGLFTFSPIFILGPLGIYALRKRLRIEEITLIALIGVNILVYASFGDPWGGWAFGPRYMIPSMAILAIFIAVWLTKNKHHIGLMLFSFVLVAISCAIALLGALTTNAVPPQVEAEYLKMPYGFLLNTQYFDAGKSSSVVFNTIFAQFITLKQYFTVVYSALLAIFFYIIVVASRRNIA